LSRNGEVTNVLDEENLFHYEFPGRKDQVDVQEQRIYAIASQHGGIPAGNTSGERGYILTFVIAYIRVSYSLI